MRTIYIAGPMRGIAEFNAPAFAAAADDLRGQGFLVFSPPEIDVGAGEAPGGKRTTSDYMELDLPFVCRADAVAVLPGWRKSVGARCEVYVARVCGKPILKYPSLQPIK